MGYYTSKIISGSFSEMVVKITELLKEEGFGVVTNIDLKHILKQKLNIDYKNYTILGACNPHLAVRALQADDKVGALLPCNVLVIDQGDGEIEIAFIDAEVSLSKIGKPELNILGREVNNTFRHIIQKL